MVHRKNEAYWIKSLKRILEWNEDYKETSLYREIQVLIKLNEEYE